MDSYSSLHAITPTRQRELARVVGQKQLLLFLVVDKELAAEEVTQLDSVGREGAEDRVVGLAALE